MANVCVQHIWPAVPGVQIAPSIAAGALDEWKLFTSFESTHLMRTKLASGQGQYKGNYQCNSFVPAVAVHSMDFDWFWSYWEGHTSTVLVETLI